MLRFKALIEDVLIISKLNQTKELSIIQIGFSSLSKIKFK